MSYFSAITLYILIIFFFLQNWLWLAGALTILFSFRFGAVTLIPLAILIDGYFGQYHSVPYLSLGIVWWFIVVEYLRPKVTNLRVVQYE